MKKRQNMAGPRKMEATRAQVHKANIKSRAKPKKSVTTTDHNTNRKTSTKNAHTVLSTTSSSKGLLDFPPEVRNKIYRYALVSQEPIDVQLERPSKGRCCFNIPPGLTLAS